MSYLDEELHIGSPSKIRVHFDQEAVPFSGDWAIVAKVTINGLYVYTYELRSGKWIGAAFGEHEDSVVRQAIDAAWSKHLADIMMRDEDGTAGDSDVLQRRVQESVR